MAPTQQIDAPLLRDQSVALVERYYEEVWNNRRLIVINDIFDWDVVVHAGGQPLNGHAPVRQIVSSFLEAFPDARHTLHDVICEGDRVVVRWSTSAPSRATGWASPPPSCR